MQAFNIFRKPRLFPPSSSPPSHSPPPPPAPRQPLTLFKNNPLAKEDEKMTSIYNIFNTDNSTVEWVASSICSYKLLTQGRVTLPNVLTHAGQIQNNILKETPKDINGIYLLIIFSHPSTLSWGHTGRFYKSIAVNLIVLRKGYTGRASHGSQRAVAYLIADIWHTKYWWFYTPVPAISEFASAVGDTLGVENCLVRLRL